MKQPNLVTGLHCTCILTWKDEIGRKVFGVESLMFGHSTDSR